MLLLRTVLMELTSALLSVFHLVHWTALTLESSVLKLVHPSVECPGTPHCCLPLQPQSDRMGTRTRHLCTPILVGPCEYRHGGSLFEDPSKRHGRMQPPQRTYPCTPTHTTATEHPRYTGKRGSKRQAHIVVREGFITWQQCTDTEVDGTAVGHGVRLCACMGMGVCMCVCVCGCGSTAIDY